LFKRVKAMLLGGPGCTVYIEPHEQPLLYDCQQVISALSAVLEGAATGKGGQQ
jgi:hypothetical protein